VIARGKQLGGSDVILEFDKPDQEARDFDGQLQCYVFIESDTGGPHINVNLELVARGDSVFMPKQKKIRYEF